ncbi:response regulator [Bradyrhizobium diazoefficiens]|nr:response regulator [Bradyrhizobium diazoefficiens]MBR0977831.1 response regulator [Bradyrhizobium diazoefficiens]MBR1007341.1 response regulator [Bradyrhizobium diazoefficiens]MBR1012818.1 response regulator [Bradyrhizobium diazoefficiens]MBR1052366.1 response regulator [Bradyrhizobium diazoefficiens]
MKRSQRSLYAVIGASVALIVTIVGGNLLFLEHSRESALLTAESDLARYSLTLAENTDRSFKSLDLVLSSVGDYLGRKGVSDARSYRQIMSDAETHVFLREKIAGLPQVDAITMIDADGKLINFSRYWPIPTVDVSDRDYFKALSTDANLETFISAPVKNRGSGTWNLYVARRVNDPNGKFMGLLLGAMSLQYIENFFGSTTPGEETTISLVREDGTLLAHFPHVEEIGQASSGGAQRALRTGGALREIRARDNLRVLRSARMLSNYPVLVAVSQTEQSALSSWRDLAALLFGMSIVSALVVLAAAVMLSRWWKKQEQLTRAAEAANASKSTFLAMMSHEIRTPMNAVLGLATNLLDTPMTPEQRSFVLSIHNAGDNLLEILNDILDFSKLESGQLSLESISFSAEALVENTLSVIGPRAAAKELKVRSVVVAGLPNSLSGDAGRIRQILLNLISNAVKFTAEGEVVITTRCVARTEDKATIRWEVSDTGIGIAPEKLDSLFTDFVQADSSINRRFGGSGLGLAICKRLIEQMDGTIDVTSIPGQGSRFGVTLTFPISDQPAIIDESDHGAFGHLREQISRLGRPLRVLIVDDNATNRLVAARMLKEFDIQINTACDGVEAVTAARQFSFDVILMDVRMPEMDGLQATRELRTRGDKPLTVPIIAFTANAFADDIAACREAGMNDFVVKPARKKAVVEAILRVWSPAAMPAQGLAELPRSSSHARELEEAKDVTA